MNCTERRRKSHRKFNVCNISVILFVSLIGWEHAGGNVEFGDLISGKECMLWEKNLIARLIAILRDNWEYNKVCVRLSGTWWEFGYSVIKIKLKYDLISRFHCQIMVLNVFERVIPTRRKSNQILKRRFNFCNIRSGLYGGLKYSFYPIIFGTFF